MTAEAPVQVTHLTPSGIEVLYQAKPKRLYRLRENIKPEKVSASLRLREELGVVTEDEEGRFLTPWVEVPSVTTVLDVLGKTLQHWGQRIGIAGVLELHRQEILREIDLGDGQKVLVVPGEIGQGLVVAGVEQIVTSLKANGLTVSQVRDKAGDRGVSVHDGFEVWCKEGLSPDPSMFQPEERHYVEGLLAFLEAAEPTAEDAEVMVGSVKHGFAGRYDVRLRLHEPKQLVVHRTPVRGPQYAVIPAGVYLADLKTSKDIFPETHFRQLEGYEGASIECGYEPTDGRFVIHVDADGNYKVGLSTATFEDFLAVLEVYRSNERMKARGSKRQKKED